MLPPVIAKAPRAVDHRAVDHRAVDNRVLGPRALATRNRLLKATAELLDSGGLLDFKVVDVARRIGTSPATFYQYFATVEDVILALSTEIGDELEPVHAAISQPWDGSGGLELARQLVGSYMRHWDRHRAVLRIRNLASEEGDQRFRAARLRVTEPITAALAVKVDESKRAGRIAGEVNSYAVAAAMVAMMERMAAYRFELEARGVDRAALIETTARIIHQSVSGRID